LRISPNWAESWDDFAAPGSKAGSGLQKKIFVDGGAVEYTEAPMADGELTDIERTWLVSIDALLVQTTVNAHGAVAGRFINLWDSGGQTFRAELAKRASVWHERHAKMQQLILNSHGACERLVRLMGDAEPPKRKTLKTNPEPRRDRVVPSRRKHTPVQEITEDEAAKFMAMLDAEGIAEVFDPGVSILDDKLFRPPLIIFNKVSIFHDDIAPAYERGAINRRWDPVKREPAIALAFDLALLVTHRESRWTWVISDRHFGRLPWGHRCKVTPEGRPGWKLITGLLDRAGLIERRSGQTWRLRREARPIVADYLLPAWVAAASDQD
tara:strand:- start:8048 stop:9022 length:975 start_codon:yes stop_codon:yes gene_type:complete